MADLIIKNATIISVDAERRVIDKGIIEITGNQITAVHDTISNGEWALPALKSSMLPA